MNPQDIMQRFSKHAAKFSKLRLLPLEKRVAYINGFVSILEIVLDLVPEEWIDMHKKINKESQETIKQMKIKKGGELN
jgi:hypothetical protein